jgi:hypothetical protein
MRSRCTACRPHVTWVCSYETLHGTVATSDPFLVAAHDALPAIGVCPRTMRSASLTCPSPSAKGAALRRPCFAAVTFPGLAGEDMACRNSGRSRPCWLLGGCPYPVAQWCVWVPPLGWPSRHSLGPYSTARCPRTSCTSSCAALAPSPCIRACLLPCRIA